MQIEDTGKNWANNGLKAGVLVCSDRYAPTASKAFHELVLSISPFVLTLLWQLSERGGVQAIKEIQDLIDRNRSLVRLTLEDSSVFTPSMVRSSMPVETVFYDHDHFPDQSRMLDDLRSRGLGVVGSNDFYWSSTQHAPFLRLALSRNEAVVRQGADVLASFQ
jgi:DNA-binding transcriptional MocR family regulator